MYIFRSTLLGVLLGSVGWAPQSIRLSTAAYASCAGPTSQWTSTYGGAAGAPLGAAKTNIETGTGTNLCAGISGGQDFYYAMVEQSSPNIAYAQTGFAQYSDTNTTPRYFYQFRNNGGTPSGFVTATSPSVLPNYVDHTYEANVHDVSTTVCSSGKQFESYLDGTVANSPCTNFDHGSIVEYSAEILYSDVHIPYIAYDTTRFCQQSTQGTKCGANTVFPVDSTADVYNNVNGCYKKILTDYFNVYDKRDNPPTYTCSR